jgi:hypothetical protein
MGNSEVHTGYWLGDRREKYHLANLDEDGSSILKCISKRSDVATWTGLLQLRIMRGRMTPVNAENFLTEDLLTSQKIICIVELFI